MAYSAKAIANYFIGKSITDPKTPLTPLKLIKLAYVAHGWYLALKDTPLINEPIEAWRYGPVVPSLYQEFKGYGNNTINQLAEAEEIPHEDGYTLDFLNEIWRHYGSWTGLQLSTWTHEEGSPWYIAWEMEGGKKADNYIIKNASIRDYFKLGKETLDS